MTSQPVTKLEAATRQLRAAIGLYFQDGEPLAIHTIAGAAYGLLRDLGGKAMIGVAQPNHVAFVKKMVDEAKNFLKHADRDPSGILTFNTDWTDFLLYEAIAMHIEVAAALPREQVIFLLWVTAKYPTVLILDELTEGRIAELRRIFPSVGAVDGQKRTFLAALSNDNC